RRWSRPWTGRRRASARRDGPSRSSSDRESSNDPYRRPRPPHPRHPRRHRLHPRQRPHRARRLRRARPRRVLLHDRLDAPRLLDRARRRARAAAPAGAGPRRRRQPAHEPGRARRTERQRGPERQRESPMILLNPGPVNVSPRVTAALARGDLCHREPEYGDLQASIRSRLVRAFAPTGGFTAVLITGSGTGALEAAVTSVLSARGRLVVVSNGVYGERIAAMAAAARLPHTVVEGAWTEPPDLAAVERALGAADVEAVAVVHHETTTGLLNPVAEVGRLAHARGKLVLVDSVSGLAGDALDLAAADLVVGTGGK